MSNTNLSEVAIIGSSINPVELLMQNYLNQHLRYTEFAQSKTNFQIEKFIGLADNTPVNCYVTTLYQTRVMNGELLREVTEATSLVRQFEYTWSKVEDKTQPLEHNGRLTWYDLEEINYKHRISELSINIRDKLQQLEFYYKVLDQMVENHGGEFTREEYEAEAPEYWSIRLQKQVLGDLVNSKFGVNSGNLEAIIHASAEAILPDSKNTAIDFPNIFGELAAGNIAGVLNHLQVQVTEAIRTVNLQETPMIDSSETFESLGVVRPE